MQKGQILASPGGGRRQEQANEGETQTQTQQQRQRQRQTSLKTQINIFANLLLSEKYCSSKPRGGFKECSQGVPGVGGVNSPATACDAFCMRFGRVFRAGGCRGGLVLQIT